MPPPGEKPLSPEAIATIVRWIELGAAYDQPLGDPQAAVARKPMEVTDADREYWAFAPLREPPTAEARIDDFVRAEQRERGLVPAAEAPPRTLIRRLFFDLVGLPPEPEDVARFVANPTPAAYEELVDRLLASPSFGERWARHWLDVARFAESHGFEHDYDRSFAFHYRDFVIRAFNRDMPYDQFVRWQLAGDELAPEEPLALMATGFLCAGVYPTQITINEAERLRYDTMDDMLATTGSAMLATTIGCARCHDHKYDPIPAHDYYRMLSTFTSTLRTNVKLELGELASEQATRFSSLERGGSKSSQYVMICSEGEHIEPIQLHTSSDKIPLLYDESYHLEAGDTHQKTGVAEPGFLQVLTRAEKPAERWAPHTTDARTSGRRAALGDWITDVEQGAGHLLARVIVNRLWHHYFGRGIVATPNNFGALGERPSHPELLDWLASELIRNGWRLKPIHKLILMSETYRVGESDSVENRAIDPENRYLWRRRPRRLEAEIVRDNALATSGLLDTTLFGPGTLDESTVRRSIYFTIKRSAPVPVLQLFDAPDTLSSLGSRPVTTTPSQALVFLNDPNFRRMAEGFARRILDRDDRVGSAYEIAFGRSPTARERELGEGFLTEQIRSHGGDAEKALTDFALALMSTNEFIYID